MVGKRLPVSEFVKDIQRAEYDHELFAYVLLGLRRYGVDVCFTDSYTQKSRDIAEEILTLKPDDPAIVRLGLAMSVTTAAAERLMELGSACHEF